MTGVIVDRVGAFHEGDDHPKLKMCQLSQGHCQSSKVEIASITC